MLNQRKGLLPVVMAAGLSLGFALTACGPYPGNAGIGSAGSPVVRDTAELASTSSVQGTSDSSARPTLPHTVKGHDSGDTKVYTFPDGGLSFTYPADWTVQTSTPPAGLPGVEALVTDQNGKDRLLLARGVTAGCAGGPVLRTVLDRAAVPGLPTADGGQAAFGFVSEVSPVGETYSMGLTDPRSLQEGDGVSSWCGLVGSGGDGLFTRVIFADPAFPSQGAAKAWMKTKDYDRLKDLLVSVTFR